MRALVAILHISPFIIRYVWTRFKAPIFKEMSLCRAEGQSRGARGQAN